uniref:Uncharacterized protein n=1 Tax=Romanomermis culicivorax TaxID=13658 RepID=A0A915J9E0_ROMCU
MSSSVSFKKSFIEVTETVRSAEAGGPVGDDVITLPGNSTIFRSKISVSNNLSSHGSGAVVDIGSSNSSSAVNACIEAEVGNGYA